MGGSRETLKGPHGLPLGESGGELSRGPRGPTRSHAQTKTKAKRPRLRGLSWLSMASMGSTAALAPLPLDCDGGKAPLLSSMMAKLR